MQEPTPVRRRNGAPFDGRIFSNPDGVLPPGWRAVLRWQLSRKPPEWPAYITTPPAPAPPASVDSGRLRVTYITHATFLIQMDGRNVITDPIWSMRAGPMPYVGKKRSVSPGLRFDDLPPLDTVLISHNHYDHLDIPTLRAIAGNHQAAAITGLGVGKTIARAGLDTIRECDWWHRVSSGPLTITYVPAQHWSARRFGDRNKTLWGGFVIEGPSGVVYFAGDTGFGPCFDEIKAAFPDIRLAILPIGAHEPRWFMKSSHMSPEDALKAHNRLDPVASIGMHFDTFPLADEAFEEAPRRLVEAVGKGEESASPFWLFAPGEGRLVPYRMNNNR